jgi:lysophospholipase L1-like esterase
MQTRPLGSTGLHLPILSFGASSLGAKFLQPDGSIAREVMGDYLHPSAKGYEIWAEALEPVLMKLLGEGK